MSDATNAPLWLYVYVWDKSQFPVQLYHIKLAYEKVLLCGVSGELYVPSRIYTPPEMPGCCCDVCIGKYMLRLFQ
jgi:hypothetical protein